MRFTKRAQRVLLLTRTEAERLQHTHIGTEHLLLGMLLDDGPVGSLLRRYGLTHSIVEDYARRIYLAQSYPVQTDLELALDLTIVLSHAAQELQVLRKHALGSDQLLVTLLSHAACHAIDIMRQLKIDFRKMQEEFKIVQGGGPPAHRLPRLSFDSYGSWNAPGALPGSPSENARRALHMATAFARQHGHAAITSSHLLVGLIEVEGQAQRVLTYLGLDAAQVRETVQHQYTGSRIQPGKGLALSIDLEDVLIAASAEGMPDENAIGTGHLLLGITLQPRCDALDVLKQFTISASRIQGQIIRKLVAE